MNIRLLLRALVMAALLFQMSCAPANNQQVYQKMTDWYRSRDPVADANENFGKKDIYVIYAMDDNGKYYPGLSPEEGARVAKKHDEKFVKGVSDPVEKKARQAHKTYAKKALKYATAYNEATVKLLKEAKHE